MFPSWSKLGYQASQKTKNFNKTFDMFKNFQPIQLRSSFIQNKEILK